MTQSLSNPQGPAPDSVTPTPRIGRSKRWLLLPVVVAIATIGFVIWYLGSRPVSQMLQVSGRLEGYETNIGTKVPGRVEQITVREGDTVERGSVIAQLDDAEIQAQLAGATARLDAARQQEYSAQLQINVLLTQIDEAQLTQQQATGDAQGRISQADATVATAEAQLAQAEALATEARSQLQLAQLDRNRFAQLAVEGAVPQQRYDQAQTNLEVSDANLNSRIAAVVAAQRQVAAARGGLVQARTTDLNPAIRQTQIDRLRQQLVQAQTQLAAAQAQVASVAAAQQQIVAQVEDLQILSPISGIITARTAEPGEVLAAGKVVVSVLDLNTVYLRGYIPEGAIGRVRVGQAARVYLDSAPADPLEGRVAAIDTQASFTPENIYFREDRVNQVFGIRIALSNPAGFAKPGMPADAEILTNE